MITQITELLEKFDNIDSDIRFMALKDLQAFIVRPENVKTIKSDNSIVLIVNKVLLRLADNISEVQNEAVKCLPTLVSNLSTGHLINSAIQPLLKPEKLVDPKATARSDKEDYSIFSTALRTIVISVSDFSSGPSLVLILLSYLLDAIQRYRSIDDIDILISLIERFGAAFTDAQINQTETGLIGILQNQTGLIQKRAIIALGKLTRYLQGDAYINLLAYITKNFPAQGAGLPTQSTKNIILLANTVIKADFSKAKQFLHEIIPQLIGTLHIELLEDEYANESTDLADVREASLTAIETIVVEYDAHTITPFLEQFTALSKAFLRFDPNFVGDDDDETEEKTIFASNGASDDVNMDSSGNEEDEDEEDEDEDDDFGDEDNDFSDDDDDQSWKLRRLAGKIIAGLVDTSPMSLASLYSETFKPIVISCIKEREDAVKITSLETFSIIVEAASSDRYFYATRQSYGNKRKSSDVNMSYTTDPQTLLGESLHVIIKHFIGLLNSKDTSKTVKHSLLTAIKSLNDVVRISSKDLKSTISAASAVANIRGSPYMSDVLQIVGSILTRNTTGNLEPFLQSLLEIIVTGISDSYYRISGEALDTVLYLFPHYSTGGSSSRGSLPTADTSQLQAALVSKVNGNSFDSDIRKKAIKALAILVQRVPLSAGETTTAISTISNQLDNELLRYEALNGIRTLTSVESTTGLNSGSAVFATALPNITHLSTEWAVKTLNSIIVFLRQSLFLIRSETLHDLRLLSQLVSYRLVNNAATAGESAEFEKFIHALLERVELSIKELKKVSGASADADLDSQPGSGGVQESSTTDLEFQLSSEIQLFAESFEGLKLLSPNVLAKIADISTHLLTYSGTSSTSIETALLAFFDKYTHNLSGNQAVTFYGSLVGSSSLISAVTGLAIVNCGLDGEIDKFAAEIAAQSALESPDLAVTEKALQVLGFVGRHKELRISLAPIYNLINNETLRSTVSSTIGKITIGGLGQYLPELQRHLGQSSEQGKQYFYLLSLKSVVVYLQDAAEKYQKETAASASSPGGAESGLSADITGFVYAPFVRAIWKTLFAIGFEDDRAQGGEKAIVAECIGRLSIIDPDMYLPELKSLLTSPEVSVRRSVVSAVKYTFGQTHEQYDRLLRPMIVDFLVLMEDENLSIRQVALSTLMSAIRNKPLLLLPHLSRLLPLLYRETYKNPALVRTVQMGPFKHEVDDGLELRKSAYEAMFTLITALPHEWQSNLVRDEKFGDRVFAGLEDDHDIRVLSCVTLGRMVAVDIRFLTLRGASGDATASKTNLERIISGFTEILETQVKANAVKQEFESQGELVRNVIRVAESIHETVEVYGGSTGQGGSAGKPQASATAPLKTLSTVSLNTLGNLSGGNVLSGTSTPATPGSAAATGAGARATVSGSGLSDGDLAAWSEFYTSLENRSFKGMQ